MRSQSIHYRCVSSLLYENNRLETESISAMSEADRYNSKFLHGRTSRKHDFAWHFLFLKPKYATQNGWTKEPGIVFKVIERWNERRLICSLESYNENLKIIFWKIITADGHVGDCYILSTLFFKYRENRENWCKYRENRKNWCKCTSFPYLSYIGTVKVC